MGYIDSWVLDKDEDSVYDGNNRILRKVPLSVLVQFTDQKWRNGTWVEEPCSWTIDGVDRPGVYPIFRGNVLGTWINIDKTQNWK